MAQQTETILSEAEAIRQAKDGAAAAFEYLSNGHLKFDRGAHANHERTRCNLLWRRAYSGAQRRSIFLFDLTSRATPRRLRQIQLNWLQPRTHGFPRR